MKVLVDAHLPPALAAWLQQLGSDAVHVHEIALYDASDRAIREYARSRGLVLITKDRDFISGLTPTDPAILWVRTGNISNATLRRRFHSEWISIIGLFEQGLKVVELR
ncbi:MAG TPA: DUF5615 family PIN-like protein [Rhizomicrobium sp.]